MLKRAVVSVVAALALGGLAIAFNPSPEKHREKIREAIAERSPLAAILGIGPLTAFVSSYHSLGVASYTVVSDRTVTVGAFGIVVFVEQERRP